MAKTIDDLIVEISGLVKTLNKQNSNSGGKSRHNGFDLTGDAIQSFAGEIRSLAETAKQLSEAQSNFATEISKTGNSKWHQYRLEMVENMKESQEMMKEFQKVFGHSGKQLEKDIKEYLETVAKLKSEEASIQEKIVAKKEILAETEQKLINDKTNIELAELTARQKFAEELERQSQREVELKDEELEIVTQLNIDKRDIELAEIEARINNKEAILAVSKETKEIAESLADFKEKLKIKEEEKRNEKEKFQQDKDVQKRILQAEEKEKSFIGKDEKQALLHREAQNIKKEWAQKGINDKGQKKGNAEWKEFIGNKKAEWHEASTGRKVGMVANAAAQGAAGAMKTIQSGKMDVSGMADKASGALSQMGPYGAAAGGLIQIFKVMFEMFSKVDKAASDYARSVGGGREAMFKMRQESASLASQMSEMGKTAYTAEEILERMAQASEALGRNLEGLSVADLRSLKDLKNFGIDDQTISQFDTFGISVHNVSKQITELYGEAGKKGLNAKATIKAFTSNLKMAQNFTFARGQKALADMAMKSAQLKFNLRDAEQFANKVSTLEGAMTAGAQLSVLGGNFAMQGNPLAMLYNGLNDVEGLQEQMLAMTKGMARWDGTKGQLDISAFDRQRLKAMSEATGIDYSDLTSQALNQARVDRVSSQLGTGFKKEEEEYIKNLASLDEKGNAYIRVGDQEYSMSDIRDNKDGVRDKLKEESEAKDIKDGADLGDIWSSTRSIQDRLDDIIKTLQTKIVALMMKMAGFKDHEKAAMKAGIDLDDKEAMAKMKKASRDINNKRIGKFAAAGATYGATTSGMFGGLGGAAGGAALGALYGGTAGVITNMFKDDSEALIEYAKENKLGAYAEQKKASGGFVYGKGGPTEDAIHAKLSNGEFVVNAEATTRHRPLLERINRGIRNGSNLMRAESVMGLSSGELRSGGNQKIDVSPIKIEFGTLELKIGDLSRVLDSNEVASRLLNNSSFVDNIVKEIGIRANFGYRKDDLSNKFLDSPFVRSF